MEHNNENKSQCTAILRVKDLQEILSISHNTAYALVRSGKIRSIKIGQSNRIPFQAVEDIYVWHNYSFLQ